MEAVVVNILSKTPDAISTHFGFRAIRVEDSHPEVGYFRGFDQYQTVCSDAEVAIAPFLGIVRKVLFGKFYFEIVNQNEVVT